MRTSRASPGPPVRSWTRTRSTTDAAAVPSAPTKGGEPPVVSKPRGPSPMRSSMTGVCANFTPPPISSWLVSWVTSCPLVIRRNGAAGSAPTAAYSRAAPPGFPSARARSTVSPNTSIVVCSGVPGRSVTVVAPWRASATTEKVSPRRRNSVVASERAASTAATGRTTPSARPDPKLSGPPARQLSSLHAGAASPRPSEAEATFGTSTRRSSSATGAGVGGAAASAAPATTRPLTSRPRPRASACRPAPPAATTPPNSSWVARIRPAALTVAPENAARTAPCPTSGGNAPT